MIAKKQPDRHGTQRNTLRVSRTWLLPELALCKTPTDQRRLSLIDSQLGLNWASPFAQTKIARLGPSIKRANKRK